ncbi:MAG: DUF4169 family protein [Gemmatimonadaceae bacterium]|nr:DUF4169 family protein [Acetobacteraceae bacterium]
MGEIVNLRRIKKRRARDAAGDDAARARAAHGRTLAEREAGRLQKLGQDRVLDGARLSGAGSEDQRER